MVVKAKSSPAPREKSNGIVVMRAGAIGDTLMATPLLRALRHAFGDRYLGLICSQMAYDVVRYNPHVDEVLALPYRHLPIWLSRAKRRIVRHFRAFHFDCVLALESERDLTELACQLASTKLITYDSSRRGKGVEIISPQGKEHAVQTNLRAAASLGVKPAGLNLELHYPLATDDVVRRRLASLAIRDQDLVVGIHAGWGSRKQDPTDTRLKSWPADRFAEVSRWLARTGARVVLTGSQTDRPLAQFIAQSTHVPVINLAGELSLLELAALIRRMRLYITIDSGPAHMAAALGTPLLTIWGPAVLESVAPIAGDGPVRILRSPPPCAPCYGTPLMKTCQNNICMKQVSVGDVVAAAEAMLGSELTESR